MSDLVERLLHRLGRKTVTVGPGLFEDIQEAATALEAKDKELAEWKRLAKSRGEVLASAIEQMKAAEARAETAEQQVKVQRDFMKELSDALISIRPLGGSEMFVKRFDEYFADPAYCKAAIEQRSEAYHEAMKESVRNRKRAETAERERNSYEKLYNDEVVERLRAERERDEARASFDAFAQSLDGPHSMPVQQNDKCWAAWKRLCDAMTPARAITGED